MTINQLITFDAGSDDYTLLHGSIEAGGNPDNCVVADPEASSAGRIRVYLPTPSVVRWIKGDVWTSGGTTHFRAFYYDIDDNYISNTGYRT